MHRAVAGLRVMEIAPRFQVPEAGDTRAHHQVRAVERPLEPYLRRLGGVTHQTQHVATRAELHLGRSLEAPTVDHVPATRQVHQVQADAVVEVEEIRQRTVVRVGTEAPRRQTESLTRLTRSRHGIVIMPPGLAERRDLDGPQVHAVVGVATHVEQVAPGWTEYRHRLRDGALDLPGVAGWRVEVVEPDEVLGRYPRLAVLRRVNHQAAVVRAESPPDHCCGRAKGEGDVPTLVDDQTVGGLPQRIAPLEKSR